MFILFINYLLFLFKFLSFMYFQYKANYKLFLLIGNYNQELIIYIFVAIYNFFNITRI